jgi:hypothetical protein
MKTLALCLIFSGIGIVHAKSSKPGQCSKTKACTTGICVSVQNSITGLEKTSQCAIEPICGGNLPGSCPTFSAWPASYDIQPVCTFVDPKNCAKPGEIGSEDDGTVTCYNMTIDNQNVTFSRYGIYKCVDITLFQEESNLPEEVVDEAMENCAGNSSDASLCNKQGTCSPQTALQVDYACKCNLGFTSDDNCFQATSNSCDNFGQCGEGGECNTSTNQCDCIEGVSGNQCSECVSNVACKNGVCEDGKCVCNKGYVGEFCQRATAAASDASEMRTTSTLVTIAIFATSIGLQWF